MTTEQTIRNLPNLAPDVCAQILSGDLDICKVADYADLIIAFGETLKDCVKKKAVQIGSVRSETMSINVRYDNEYDYSPNPEFTELTARLKALKSEMLEAYKDGASDVILPEVTRKEKPTVTITRIKKVLIN